MFVCLSTLGRAFWREIVNRLCTCSLFVEKLQDFAAVVRQHLNPNIIQATIPEYVWGSDVRQRAFNLPFRETIRHT